MVTNNFLQHFNQHSNYLRGFAMKLSRDKTLAEDLFQETALKVFRHQDKYKAGTNLRAWLSTIMKNTFINLVRQTKRRNEVQDTTEDAYLLNSSDRTITNDGEVNIQVKELKRLIDQLDEGYRIPILMVYQGYQYDEIQKAMGNLPMGTVKSRIHIARKLLQKQITAMYDDCAA